MSAAVAALAFTGCKHDDEAAHHFDNKLYFTTNAVTDDLLIKADVQEASRSMSVRLALPAERDICVTIGANPDLTEFYNKSYGDEAETLDAKYYEIPENRFNIKKGDITTDDLVINFKNTGELDAKKRYVLPVSILSIEGVDVLQSKSTLFFVFKGAALINVVANIAEMHFPVSWCDGDLNKVRSMKSVTIECLVRSEDWSGGREGVILSSIIGIEGKFLIRIGDADRPCDQLQLVTPTGNWPAPNAAPALPTNEWIHIAIVWDATTGDRIYYQNGVAVAQDTNASGTVTLLGECYVGKSYDDLRWLPGEISELRVWNVQRSAEDIATHMYQVDPKSEGLVAYWHFNEGDGSVIKDATEDKTDLSGNGTPKWIPVELPPIK